jgi:ABC-type ATPase with predicted acetyltransferase domain
MKRVKITEDLAYPNAKALDRLTGGQRPVSAGKTPKSGRPVSTPPMPMSTMIKLSVFLHRDEDAYLEALAATAKFSGGRKLSKTKLIETMVKAFRRTNLDVRGVKDDQELLNRVLAQLRLERD